MEEEEKEEEREEEAWLWFGSFSVKEGAYSGALGREKGILSGVGERGEAFV